MSSEDSGLQPVNTVNRASGVLVAHTYNPSYSGGREQDNRSSKPAWAWDPILKIPNTKQGWWSGSRCRPWVQTPVQKKKKEQRMGASPSTLEVATTGYAQIWKRRPRIAKPFKVTLLKQTSKAKRLWELSWIFKIDNSPSGCLWDQ
jgi:hypothetical protein